MEDEEHECEFTLYVPKIGEANLKSIIFFEEEWKLQCSQHRRIFYMEK